MNQKSKLEIIEETAAAYNNSNRSITCKDGITECEYIGEDGRRCAFSRCCKEDEETNAILIKCNQEPLWVFDDEEIEFVLKEEYKGHSDVFWTEIQRLHDKDSYWGENGLSELGEARKKELLKEWS